MAKRSVHTILLPNSEDESHVQSSLFTAPATKSEHAKDHHRVQSAAPATEFSEMPMAPQRERSQGKHPWAGKFA